MKEIITMVNQLNKKGADIYLEISYSTYKGTIDIILNAGEELYWQILPEEGISQEILQEMKAEIIEKTAKQIKIEI